MASRAPGLRSPGEDAPLARHRPGYPLVGCSPAVPTSVSPGRCDLPQGSSPCKASLLATAPWGAGQGLQGGKGLIKREEENAGEELTQVEEGQGDGGTVEH